MTATNLNILLNPNIVVKLVKSSHKIFTEGVLARDGPKKTLKNWMDRDVSKLGGTGEMFHDEGAVALFKTDGSFQENKSS